LGRAETAERWWAVVAREVGRGAGANAMVVVRRVERSISFIFVL
jgi:hypothetical protein